MKNEYQQRVVDHVLRRKLESKGAILIEGAKWCGKTSTGEHAAKSILYMSDPKDVEQNLHLAAVNPEVLLRGAKPRLIDEWQLAPKLWDAIRFAADHEGELGLFIMTGSAVPADMSEVRHSGTGRIGWLKMRPMTLWESGESSGEVSLASLFEGNGQISGVSNVDLQTLAYITCRGGWPLACTMKKRDVALDQAVDYVKAVQQRDLSASDGVERDPERVKLLMRSLARNQGSQAPVNTIRQDMMTNDIQNLDEDTVASYIKALKRIFVVEDVTAWNPNLRSKTAIRTSDTRYFVDPSIATASLGLGPDDLVNDLNTFGLIFETLCIRDLRVYAESIDGEVFHYRDKTNLECDAVVHLRNGKYGLIEIKLGGEKLIEEGIKTLNKLEQRIDTDKMKSPSFKMVLTGVGKYAYRREDGILIVPIGCLKD
ncbi:MAG: DUF4143 domain-containing protein [Paludibacteraceae bacterium]|nr:DUF4143 domain-containing protein [Paludibacteraceae bacterium]